LCIVIAISNLEPLRRPFESAQYAGAKYRKLLKKAGLTQSMSRKGECLDNAPKPIGQREVWFKGKPCPTDLYDRASFSAGAEFAGPAIVEQIDSTVVVPPNTSASVDQYMNLLIRVED
jgi:N-methylhydantoinase A